MSVKAPVPVIEKPTVRERIAGERQKLIGFAALFVIAMLYPLVGKPILSTFGPTVFGDFSAALNTTLIFTLLAIGLNIVVGYAGLLDLGYAAFFAIGGYTMGFLTGQQSPLYDTPFHTNFWIALPISFLMAALFGVLLGAPTLGLKGDYLAIVTLGFGEIVPITFNTLNKVTKGDTGLAGLEQPGFFGFQFTSSTVEAWYWLTIIVVAFSIFLVRRLVDSRIGRAWMAMREDEIAASAMGINLVRTKLLAFGLGASFAGFAGAIAANSQGSANPSQFRYDVSIFVLAMVIFGGIGNLWGVIGGSFILVLTDRVIIPFFTGLVKNYAESIELVTRVDDKGVRISEPSIIKDILTNIGTDSRLFIFGLILVLMMITRPAGLFPSGRRKMEMRAGDESEIQPMVARSEDPLEKFEESHNLNRNPSIGESNGVPKDKK